MRRLIPLLAVLVFPACDDKTPDDPFTTEDPTGEVITECVEFGSCFRNCDNLLWEQIQCANDPETTVVDECPTDDEVDAAVAMCDATCSAEHPEVTESERALIPDHVKCTIDAVGRDELFACDQMLPAECVEP